MEVKVLLTPLVNSLSISLCSVSESQKSLFFSNIAGRVQQVMRKYQVGAEGGKKSKTSTSNKDVYQAALGLPGF
jgi:hypothetical protein